MRSIQKAFYAHTYQRYELLAPNVFLRWDNEMDFAGIRKSGYVDEIEMKVSISDFKADFKKTSKVKSKYKCIHSPTYEYEGFYTTNKHRALEKGELITNYFSFLLPRDMEVNIPDYAGLYVFYEDNAKILRVQEVKKPILLHKNKISDILKYKLARKMHFKYWDLID